MFARIVQSLKRNANIPRSSIYHIVECETLPRELKLLYQTVPCCYSKDCRITFSIKLSVSINLLHLSLQILVLNSFSYNFYEHAQTFDDDVYPRRSILHAFSQICTHFCLPHIHICIFV